MSSGQSVDPRIRRAGVGKDIAELFRRVEELERVPPFEPDAEIWPTINWLPLLSTGTWNAIVDSSRINNFYLESGGTDYQRWFVPIGPRLCPFHLWLDGWWDEGFGTLTIDIAGPFENDGSAPPGAASSRWINLCTGNFDKPGPPPDRIVGDIGVAIPTDGGFSLLALVGEDGDELTTITGGLGDGGAGYYHIRAVPAGIIQLSEAFWMTQSN